MMKAGNSKMIVGYDLGSVNSQISYYSAEVNKVETLPSVAGTQLYNIPTVLCKRYGTNQWLYGKEAVRAAQDGQGILVDGLLELALGGEPILIEEVSYDPVALLTLFIKKSLVLLGPMGGAERIGAFLITCEQMSEQQLPVLEKALAGLALKAKYIRFQSYEESFYQYMIHQSAELRQFRTVMLQWEREELICHRMIYNEKTTPSAVFVEHEKYLFPAGEETQMDSSLCKIAQEICLGDRISTVYLIGEGFKQEWMKESLRYLCQGRRVFLGSNLFSQGAVYGMMERLRPSSHGKRYALIGQGRLKANVGMRVFRQGEASYLALLDAGTDWYDAKAERECYVKDKNVLEILIEPLDGRRGKLAQMTLEGLPEGPARVLIGVSMKDENTVSISVRDLGFGEFRPAGELAWCEEVSV